MTSLWLDRSPTIATDPFLADTAYDDVVVGAGLTGLVTATLLARAGRRVAVLEARHVGAVTTGNTTAKLSLLQGTTLSSLVRHHSENVAEAYVEGNREALAWALRYCDDHDIPVERRDAYTYAGKRSGASAVRKEFEIARAGRPGGRAGRRRSSCPTPPTARSGCPTRRSSIRWTCSTALAAELRSRDGVLVEGVRVVDVAVEKRATRADQLGHGDRGARHPRHRHPLPGPRPLLRQGDPACGRTRWPSGCPAPFPRACTCRRTRRPGRCGRRGTTARSCCWWAATGTRSGGTASRRRSWWPTSPAGPSATSPARERTHVWSAQDYQPHNHVPFVGKLPRGGGRVYVATGYNKWGMTNAIAAGLRISAELLGGNMPWAKTLGTRISKPASAVQTRAGEPGRRARPPLQGWAGAELRPLSDADRTPPEGAGVVGNVRGAPVAVSTVDGRTCAVSAICTPPGWRAAVQRPREVLGLPAARVPVRRRRVGARGTGHQGAGHAVARSEPTAAGLPGTPEA